jgi:hypothetical protein
MANFRKFPDTIRLKCDGSWYVSLSSFVLYLPHVIVMLFMYLDGDRDMWIAGGSRLLLRVFKPGLMSSSQEQIGRADIEVTSIAGMTGNSTRCLLQSRMYADQSLHSRDVLKFCTHACRSPHLKVRLRNTGKERKLDSHSRTLVLRSRRHGSRIKLSRVHPFNSWQLQQTELNLSLSHYYFRC